ncbi:50S ribosomal protein L7/L12 [Anatilimnocola floriformis]|uniref:50S ribosomal protein L7/L12 n=1 Tax=Anatilimnocola floriformis TaxID=2948575 RepID=UPI0020C55293|nr:50S ribosomal protein L7/L12 [Anatilimnocola floriformis]
MAEVDINALGDQIANLTLKQAKELSDYIKETYKIEPAAGGGVMMAAPAGDGGGAAAPAAQTEFDVVLTAAGDKKLEVVKVVKAITGVSLMDAKKLVDAPPAKIKEKASKADADKAKAELEAAGATVELK